MTPKDFSQLGWTTYLTHGNTSAPWSDTYRYNAPVPQEPEITDFAEAQAVIAYIKSTL
jgi:hypothetical protein